MTDAEIASKLRAAAKVFSDGFAVMRSPNFARLLNEAADRLDR